MREMQRVERGPRAGGDGGVDLARRDSKPRAREVDAVEAQRIFGERRIAARAHVGDDPGHRLVDIGRRLALGGEQRGEFRRKALRAGVQEMRHRLLRPRV